MNQKLFALLLALIIVLPVSSQQKKMKLAVIDPVIAGEKLTDGLAISVREIVSSSFVNNADNYAIVERSLIDKVMQEAKFSNSDAVDESQATQLGKLAGADKVVLTVISRFDNRCMMSIKLIDVESATIDRQISKLVDISSVLDVTEPLTMAVLGKGDANLIPNASNQQPSATPGGDREQSGGLKGLFGKVKDKKDTPQSTASSPQSGFVAIPEFSGTGINYLPWDFEAPIQGEDFMLYNFAKMYNVKDYNVIIDFSDTRVVGMNLLKFRELKQMGNEKVFGYDFFNRMNSEVSRFINALRDETKSNFGLFPEAPVTLVVKVRDIDEPGRENISDYIFINSTTGEILAGIRLKSKGGRFGSFTNLFGDALEEDAAPNLAKKLKSANKKFKKLIK